MNTANIAPNEKPYLQFLSRDRVVFACLWLLTFLIYLPAAKAGWVMDSAGWLQNIRKLGFIDYVNNAQSGIPSLYQFTQLTTYIFYKVFNANPYAWHTLMVTIHAINAFLFFIICRQLFVDSGVKRGQYIALAGVALYTACPHISEVIVWEAAFHYLQGFLLILLVLYWVQKFQQAQLKKYALFAGIIYFCSSYALEIFYLTPWFTLAMAIFYRLALGYDTKIFRKTLTGFFLPQIIIFVLHIIVLRAVYHGQVAHIGENLWQPFSSYICKAPRYLFHILFFGRFIPQNIRMQVYLAVGSTQGLIIFYNIVVLICCALVSRIKTMGGKGRVGVLLLAWLMISVSIVMPLAFPISDLVAFDRYTYFIDPFVLMLLALLGSYISYRFVSIFLLSLYGGVSLYFTTKENLLWKHSAYIINRLLHDFPDPGNKTVVLLDLPQHLEGVPMIGAEKEGQFKMMYEMFMGKKLSNKVYDVVAFNMNYKDDGVHVKVINDSLIHVTFNQWGSWWWYASMGAGDYENEDYKLVIKKDLSYELTLKHPADQYMLLYMIAGHWQTVDWNKKGDQY